MGMAGPPRCALMISAMMQTAISAGVRGADVDADGRVDAVEFLGSNALLLLQQVEDGADAALAADHADVGYRDRPALPADSRCHAGAPG